ncbi:MAG: hypothetical protein ACKOAY_02070 [Haliscomenobacter sp.]
MKKHLLLVLTAATLFACSQNDENPTPDISHIQVPFKLRRFEQAFFNLDTANIEHELAQLEQEYGEFAEVFFQQVIPAKNPHLVPEGPATYLKGFITHPQIRHLYDTCEVVYADFSAQEKAFKQAFRYLKYYFPELPTPDVTTYVSGYSIGSFIYAKQSLAVGLDFFLGSSYPYQKYNPQNPNFSQYLTRSFTPDHLVLKTLIPLASDLSGPIPGDRLLDHIVHTGKQMYILNRLLPELPDSILFEVSDEQATWLRDNERDIWAFFLSEDFLYSSDWQKIRKYVEYSPNSPGMPAEAPGRTGTWLGWHIVRSYMRQYPETTMKQLLEITDSQKFLQLSRYKPPR